MRFVCWCFSCSLRRWAGAVWCTWSRPGITLVCWCFLLQPATSWASAVWCTWSCHGITLVCWCFLLQPATVSRCGMVYLEPSWYHTCMLMFSLAACGPWAGAVWCTWSRPGITLVCWCFLLQPATVSRCGMVYLELSWYHTCMLMFSLAACDREPVRYGVPGAVLVSHLYVDVFSCSLRPWAGAVWCTWSRPGITLVCWCFLLQPATVSRCGMVYLEPSWYHTCMLMFSLAACDREPVRYGVPGAVHPGLAPHRAVVAEHAARGLQQGRRRGARGHVRVARRPLSHARQKDMQGGCTSGWHCHSFYCLQIIIIIIMLLLPLFSFFNFLFLFLCLFCLVIFGFACHSYWLWVPPFNSWMFILCCLFVDRSM